MRRARKAIETFAKKDGSFWRDSTTPDTKDSSRITTTARCYMALANVERQLSFTDEEPNWDWKNPLWLFTRSLPIEPYCDDNGRSGFADKTAGTKKDDLNFFEIAHLADFKFSRRYCDRFDDKSSSESCDWCEKKSSEKCDHLFKRVEKFLRQRIPAVECQSKELPFFDNGKANSSRHYFVTLHTLRALAILAQDRDVTDDEQKKESGELPTDETVCQQPNPTQTQESKNEENAFSENEREFQKRENSIADEARRFCIEQCFYYEHNIRHRQDPARLVFATLIYCMYGSVVDRDVMDAIVEAISGLQESSGKWPASHPIITGDGKKAWYIASAELALCLTWLYFQPRLPDTARRLILGILERHFRNWIIPTFRQVPKEHDVDGKDLFFGGWFDDSSIGQDKVVGWATAIVCHFLANYHAVLNDHINRSVIESLELQDVAERYLVDESLPKRNTRWTSTAGSGNVTDCWPDLPPIAWLPPPDDDELAEEIFKSWTDPEIDAALSRSMAKCVLKPILESPTSLPKRDKVAGILTGPPGTRKTSLVKVLSKVLRWPYVPVPASTIFYRGFDKMEAQASTVFRNLNYLTQCVIFFDEFEEFFRDRKEAEEISGHQPPGQNGFSPHNRTIAAFTTAAMLPRLQELHDVRRSLIFLATNHYEKLDSAIVRAGRFDFRAEVNHPKICRFRANKGGYYMDPTIRTLKDLQLEPGAGELEEVAKAVEEALFEDPLVMCKLGNRDRVEFLTVEIAVKEAYTATRSGQTNGTPGTYGDLKKVVAQKLADRIKSENDQEKGPDQLSECK